MDLRFSENPKVDPLAISATSGNDSGDQAPQASCSFPASPGKFDAYFGGPGPGTAVLVL